MAGQIAEQHVIACAQIDRQVRAAARRDRISLANDIELAFVHLAVRQGQVAGVQIGFDDGELVRQIIRLIFDVERHRPSSDAVRGQSDLIAGLSGRYRGFLSLR